MTKYNLKKWEIEENKKIILMPGRLTSWKGQELFIEAINLVNIELGYTAFYAVLLGSEQGRDLYKKLIRLSEQYRMTKQLKFIDNCKNMALAYKISDIIISEVSIEPEAFGRVAVDQSMQKQLLPAILEVRMKLLLMKKLVFYLRLETLNL